MTTKFIEAIGRRKTSSARVRITESAKQSVSVNGKPVDEYFVIRQQADTAIAPLAHSEVKYAITVLVKGGGIAGQADAVRHGIARALIVADQLLRTNLKKEGFLKRDPRAKERRKPGLLKARKAPQWSKR